MIAKVVGQKVATANRAPARGKPEFAAISELDPFPEQGIGVEGKSKRNLVQAWFSQFENDDDLLVERDIRRVNVFEFAVRDHTKGRHFGCLKF